MILDLLNNVAQLAMSDWSNHMSSTTTASTDHDVLQVTRDRELSQNHWWHCGDSGDTWGPRLQLHTSLFPIHVTWSEINHYRQQTYESDIGCEIFTIDFHIGKLVEE